jgi:hypothetical protein
MDHQVISIDVNFGLTSKMNAGQSYEPPKHGTRCFLSEEDVSRLSPNTMMNPPPQNDVYMALIGVGLTGMPSMPWRGSPLAWGPPVVS